MNGEALNSPTDERIIETENELVAMLACDSKYIGDIRGLVSPEDFYMTALGGCYRFLAEKYDRYGGYTANDMLDYISRNGGEETAACVKNSVRNVASLNTEEITARARRIRRYSNLRQAKRIAGELAAVSPDTVEDAAEEAMRELSEITGDTAHRRSEPVSVSELAADYLNEIFSDKPRECFPVKYPRLDSIIAMSKSDLWVIAARPSVGKSAFAGNLAVKFAMQGYRTTLFTLEMSSRQQLDRIFAAVGRIPCSFLSNNSVRGRYEKAAGEAGNTVYNRLSSLFIDDNTYETVSMIKRKCIRNRSQIIIIDYLQLLTPDFRADSKANEVGEITRRLKIMAGELDALVILLSQLNRDVEKRSSNRPVLSDLRDSGSIEQDATGIIFLSKINPDDNNSDILADVAKNRYGPAGQAVFAFDRQIQTFFGTDKDYVPPEKKKREY